MTGYFDVSITVNCEADTHFRIIEGNVQESYNDYVKLRCIYMIPLICQFVWLDLAICIDLGNA